MPRHILAPCRYAMYDVSVLPYFLLSFPIGPMLKISDRLLLHLIALTWLWLQFEAMSENILQRSLGAQDFTGPHPLYKRRLWELTGDIGFISH